MRNGFESDWGFKQFDTQRQISALTEEFRGQVGGVRFFEDWSGGAHSALSFLTTFALPITDLVKGGQVTQEVTGLLENKLSLDGNPVLLGLVYMSLDLAISSTLAQTALHMFRITGQARGIRQAAGAWYRNEY